VSVRRLVLHRTVLDLTPDQRLYVLAYLASALEFGDATRADFNKAVDFARLEVTT
jgi:hypothetical protein